MIAGNPEQCQFDFKNSLTLITTLQYKEINILMASILLLRLNLFNY